MSSGLDNLGDELCKKERTIFAESLFEPAKIVFLFKKASVNLRNLPERRESNFQG